MTDLCNSPATKARAGLRGDWRLILLMGGFALCYATVGLSMAHMVATEPSEPQLARSDSAGLPVRGEITDRNGQLLAANLPAWSLYAHPRDIKDPVTVSRQLVDIFPELDREGVLKKLTDGRRFVWIKRPIGPREKQAVHDLGTPGLHFGRREMRIYPAGRTAAHVVGGVKAAREDVRFAELTGSGGIEKYFDDRLRDPQQVAEPLMLSIDMRVQQAIRQELAEGMARLTAKGASAVLMEVATGRITGMVSLPDFNPNRRPERHLGPAELSPRFNRAALGRYELGSTFKPLTAAMALETGVAHARTMLKTPSRIRYGRHSIGDSHRMPKEMSLEDIIVKSSNVGTAKLSMMVGTRRFKDYLNKLGFFDPSGLELAEAARAQPLLPPRWTDLSSMTISYGHGLAASPVHLAAAYATLANNGRTIHPTLTMEPVVPGPRVFTERTAREMLRILREVVERGTAKRANVPGYEVGGKTGTAEKFRPGGGYYSDRVISTFASVFPTSSPRYVLIVSLDEPTDRSGRKPVRSAGRTAVPVAAQVIRRIAPLLGMRPQLPEEEVVSGLRTSLE
ncbi:MAG: peptidoglycan D,D-transpeptidase FtsI family protein [Paracoccaceae bacterium]